MVFSNFVSAIAIKTECVLKDASEVGNTASTSTSFDQTSDAVALLDTTAQLSRAFICLDGNGNLNSLRMEFTDDASNN